MNEQQTTRQWVFSGGEMQFVSRKRFDAKDASAFFPTQDASTPIWLFIWPMTQQCMLVVRSTCHVHCRHIIKSSVIGQ